MTIPNVITGMIMLAMPLPVVFKLNVASLQKIALGATFLHGIMWVRSYLPLLEESADSRKVE